MAKNDKNAMMVTARKLIGEDLMREEPLEGVVGGSAHSSPLK